MYAGLVGNAILRFSSGKLGPMALGTGLGSELRASMGIAALGGMFVSTLVSLYFVPALYASGRDGSR